MRRIAAILLALGMSLSGAIAQAENDAPNGPGAGGPSIEEPAAPTFDREAELERLQPFLDDEEKAVEAVRQFDRLQQRLASWDNDLAELYAAEGDADLSRVATERARERMQAVYTAYKQILERYPDNARAHNFIGEVEYDWLGYEAPALASWKRSRELDDQLAAPRNNLAIYYSHVGEYEQSLQLFDEVMALEPDNPDYLFNLTQIFLIHPRHIEAHYGIDRAEVYRRAMEMSRKAASLLPGDYTLTQDYAVNHFAAQNFGVTADWAEAAKAWQAAREAVRRSDELFYTWLNEGRVWLRAENNKEAARCFREALAILPESEIAQQLLERAEGGG